MCGFKHFGLINPLIKSSVTFNNLNFLDLVSSEFAVMPKNTCAFIGELVELNCSLTTHGLQHWQGPYNIDISENHIIDYRSKDKYTIFGRYNLHILNFDFTSAGTYKCIDTDDYSHTYITQVVAIGR